MSDLLMRIPRLHPDVGVERVGGRLMAAGVDFLHAFEDERGEVSEVAERIVELCDGRRTVGDIVDALCGEFDVERPVCVRDTAAFVQVLIEKQVLVLG